MLLHQQIPKNKKKEKMSGRNKSRWKRENNRGRKKENTKRVKKIKTGLL